MHKITTLKRNLNKWTDTFMRSISAKMLNKMKAHASDILCVEMYAVDLANIYHVCHLIKNGEYTEAEEIYYSMDIAVRNLFPTRLVKALGKMDNIMWELHKD